MPPKFKLGDNVIYKSKPYTMSYVTPFTLEHGDEVNVQELGLGKCRVRRRHKGSVLLEPLQGYMSNSDFWRKLTQVDQPPGIPVPSYELNSQDGSDPFWAKENTLELEKAMPPKFKPRDTVIFDNSPQNNPFAAHKPEGEGNGSIHVVATVLPFTLSTGQPVNVPNLGSCTVIRVVGTKVNVRRHKDSQELFMNVTDVDEPAGKPIPSYELKGQVEGELGDTFWAPENTLTLVEAHDPDPNVFLSTTWQRPGSYGERRSMRNQSATNAWVHF